MGRLISVIMPVYNAERFVADAIRSVVNQTHEEWELLIVNDGSSDRSEHIIQSFQDNRIHYFFQQNRGVSAARNVALRHAKGDFFCFLDADDVYTANALSARLPIFDTDSAVAFVDGAVEVFDHTMQHILRTWKPSFRGNAFSSLTTLSDSCFFGNTWMIKNIPGVTYQFAEDLAHAEDLFFYITIAHQGMYSFTPATILHYRKNEGSAMSNLDGLARGYTALRQRINLLPGPQLSFIDQVVLQLKTRKIMFLSFLDSGKILKAFRYAITGSI